MKPDSNAVYTIGRERHVWQDFLALLRKYEIAFLGVISLKRLPLSEASVFHS